VHLEKPGAAEQEAKIKELMEFRNRMRYLRLHHPDVRPAYAGTNPAKVQAPKRSGGPCLLTSEANLQCAASTKSDHSGHSGITRAPTNETLWSQDSSSKLADTLEHTFNRIPRTVSMGSIFSDPFFVEEEEEEDSHTISV
jgi:hypothetical protein